MCECLLVFDFKSMIKPKRLMNNSYVSVYFLIHLVEKWILYE